MTESQPAVATAAEPNSSPRARNPASVLSYLAFMGFIVGLAVLAVVSALTPPVITTGLPRDPDVDAATARLRDHLRLETGGLRYWSSLFGSAETGNAFSIDEEPRTARAEADLLRARERDPSDPRLMAAIASLDLMCGRLTAAQRGFEHALDLASDYGEAHLGLGTVLAQIARRESDLRARRRLQLRAIAQFANVLPADPVYLPALYDRALLLARVGRKDEARAIRREYLIRDSTSIWAIRIRVALAREAI